MAARSSPFIIMAAALMLIMTLSHSPPCGAASTSPPAQQQQPAEPATRPSTRPAGAAAGPVRLIVRARRSRLPAGEAVDLDLVLENVSTDEVTLWLQPADWDFRISATLDGKKEVSPTAYGDRIRRERGLTGVARAMVRLKPGKSVATTVRASRLCDMTLVGTYVIGVTFVPSEPDPRGYSLGGNQIHIEVTTPNVGSAIPEQPAEGRKGK
jgi:hypothetical protein